MAYAVADAADATVERLQCYQGINEEKAIGKFDEPLQRLCVELKAKSVSVDWESLRTELHSQQFFGAGPLLRALQCGRPVTKEAHEGFLNERDLQRTATKPAAGRTVATGAGTLGSIPPFGDQQPWQAPPYQPGSAGAETPDLGKAEREAMEKSSLIYVRNVSANSASAQARGIFDDPASELGLGLATGTRLRARTESPSRPYAPSHEPTKL